MSYHMTAYLREVLGDPQRDGCAPVAVSGNGPIAGIPEPVVESLLLHKLRNPGRRREGITRERRNEGEIERRNGWKKEGGWDRRRDGER